MEVDGKEFLRNVGIEQDKERLIQEQKKLDELKRASVKREQNYKNTNNESNNEESAFVDLSIGNDSPKQNNTNNVDDIILDTSTQNNKKKYIMLGFGLILLFIITVLVIRLISNNDTENKLNDMSSKKTEVAKEDILNKIDSNDEYQKVIDRKIAMEESSKNIQKQKQEINEIIIPEQKSDDVPLILETPKQKEVKQRDLFELDKKAQKVLQEKQKVIKKVVQPKVLTKPKKEIVVPPVKEKNLSKESTSLSGYFVQIGAFTKAPNKNLLKNISKKGYSSVVYKLVIKGKMYNKVLIGSYKTRAEATAKLSQIKADFNNPNAYILKF